MKPTVADQPLGLLSFDDIEGLRKRILEKAKETFSYLPPLEYGNYELRIENVDYDTIPKYSIHDEMKAILNSKDLTARLRGDVVLYDKLNDRPIMKKRMSLLNVPYLSSLGTFIFGGNSYSIVHQMRLRPGVYVRIKENGMVEALVNTIGGNTHHYELDPEKGTFYLKYGTRTIPLLSVLRALGAKDEDIIKYWGEDIFKANAAISKSTDIMHLMKQSDYGMALSQFQDWTKKIIFDPTVNQFTLGKPISNLTAEAVLIASKKMLDVYRGTTEQDERDSLVFQQFVGPEDIIAERINYVHNQLRKYIIRAIRKKSLDVIPPSPYDAGVQQLLAGSGLVELLEEINPTEILERMYRVIKTGEGGIEDPQRIKDDPRMIVPSQFGFIDPAVTGALSKCGVDNRFSWLVMRDKEGKVYALFKDVKNNSLVWRSPVDLMDAVVTFPGELEKGTRYVRAIHRGRLKFVPREQVQYQLPFVPQMFNVVSNYIPAPTTVFPQRLLMGEKMHLQALPLKEPEEPLVQVSYPLQPNTSFQRFYRKFYKPVFSEVDGRVEKISPNEIVVVDDKGKKHKYELYNNFPFNRKTFIHNTPVVKEGDVVKAGQLLAKSNFTDDRGNPAFGLNAYVAYIPYRGFSYEDAVVISESFAKRLTSQHLYQEQLDLNENVKLGKTFYMSQFPGKYPKSFYESYDDDGVILPGTKVVPGQPLILAIAETFNLAGRRKIFKDISVVWESSVPGEVVHVHKTDKYIYVAVKAEQPAIIGDKLVGRVGDKGVIGYIIPDDKMPYDSEGRRFDMLINPMGIPTRTNLSQVIEAVLGKIAKQRNEPYILPSTVDNFWEFANRELEKYGVKPDDYVFDPETGRKIGPVLTGYRYIMKLHHTAESKLQEREFAEYTSEDLPARGGKEGAKKIGILELMGILGHSAYKVLRDAKLIRGQKNDNFWFEFMQGGLPPIDKAPLVFDKFINQLKAAGINVEFTGTGFHVFALTNDDIKSLVGPRELKNSKTVAIKGNELVPEKGGLFDETITGGLDGQYWSFFRLAEMMPSPVMENVFMSFLDVTEDKYRKILAGKENIPGTALTGPDGLYKYFTQSFNLDAEIKKTEMKLKDALQQKNVSETNKLTKRLRFLMATKENKQHPSQWFWDRVPVIPPKFRPIVVTDYSIVIADVNTLYQDLMEANTILSEQKNYLTDLSDSRLAVYDALKAVVGIGEPIQVKHKLQELQGFIGQIASQKSKYNYVLRKLLSITADLTGRAVIIPNPGLKIDEVGLPVEQAWKLYRPFIIRRLVQDGYNLMEAFEHYLNQTPAARERFLEEIKVRPVIVNRAPVLHKYGVMAFWPVLTRNKVIEFSPFVCATFGADFDGDAVQVHVPVSPDAVKEAIDKMLPSKNLLSAANFDINYPIKNEFLAGLWYATSQRKQMKPIRFRTVDEVIKAFKRGEVDVDTPVIVDYQ
ncbi:MAG: hypothetical protein QXQ37_03000 [Nitrososphaerota archaeon]